MPKQIVSQLKRRRRHLLETLMQLVGIATVNPPGDRYRECAEVLAAKLKAVGMKTRVVRVPDAMASEYIDCGKQYPRYVVFGRWGVGAEKTLHFNGHYDVVPVDGQWRFGPFEARVKDGWMYGRGSGDMKGSITALLGALEVMYENDITPAMNIEVSFTPDEETGGHLGAGYVAHHLTKADYAVICEGDSGKNVSVGHNGILWMQCDVKGRSAHGSQPNKGVNAFEQMAALTGELQKYKRKIARRKFVAPSGKVMHPTVNLGGEFCSGSGAKINTVPASASFSVDRRLLVNEKLTGVEREFRAALRDAKQRHKKLSVTTTRVTGFDGCFVDPTQPLAKEFARAVREVKDVRPRYSVTGGFTDMHFFAVDKKIPSVGYGIKAVGYHGVDERVHIDDLIHTAGVYGTFMTGWDGG